ncbi:DUF4129 domain-containing protein [Fictibacillus iocasae]|uniref:DUF4129 domain-containing protein n=1 Tax=Fictibacillus iocasae TaxID=2715437 RepID=A0ABW2NQ54_9BACL
MNARFRTAIYMLNLSYEGTLFFMAAVLLGGESTWAFAGSFTFSFLMAAALPLLLFLRSDKPAGWMLYLFIPLSFLLFYFAAGLPPFTAAIMSTALLWRSFVNWTEGKNSDAEKILFITLFILLFIAFFLDEERISLLLISGCLQAFLLLLLKMVYRWDNMTKSIALREASFAGVFMLVMISAGLLLTVFKTIISTAMISVFYMLYFSVILPLISLLSHIPLFSDWLNTVKEKSNEVSDSQKAEEPLQQIALNTNQTDLAWAGWSLAAVLLALALFFLYKKKFNFSQAESGAVIASSFHPSAYSRNKTKKQWFQSDNVIRRQMAALEKELHKKGLDRLTGESASSWFQRLNLQSESARHVLSLYEKVRYGELSENTIERKQFKAAIKHIRQEIKEQ